MSMKRRAFLKKGSSFLAFAGLVSLDLPGLSGLSKTARAQNITNPLPIPELLENLDKSGETATFALEARAGSVEFFHGMPTATLGYNGNYLGPTIRVKNGQRFKLNFKNKLKEVTTLHWHGLHVPPNWDGGPRQPIPNRTEWQPEFTIKQEAATLWYHPHGMGLTGSQVYKGLAGLYIIEDEVSDKLAIPKTYGVDDIPLVLQDRRFFDNGQFAYIQSMHDVINGVVGNYLLVNGALQPTLKLQRSLIRLRVVNGSNSSIYRISFNERRPFRIIATDGGFLERPVEMTSVILSAGERAELLLDFSDLENGNESGLRVEQFQGESFSAMKIQLSGSDKPKQAIPAFLRPIDRIEASSANRVRRFVMDTMGGNMMGIMGGGLTINGKKMNMNRIDERVSAGTTEIWEISNRSGMMMVMPHSMHIHDVQFQILSRNGQPPEPQEQGRKDTVLISPGEVVRVIIRFGDYKGVYMYHCHLLEHEDDGMMGQFEVI